MTYQQQQKLTSSAARSCNVKPKSQLHRFTYMCTCALLSSCKTCEWLDFTFKTPLGYELMFRYNELNRALGCFKALQQ